MKFIRPSFTKWLIAAALGLVFGVGQPVYGAAQVQVEYQSLQSEVTVGDTFTTQLQINASGFFSERIPIDVVLVMDTSGSMNWRAGRGLGSRLQEAKQAMKSFVQAVSGSDERGALITFNGYSARLIRPLYPFDRDLLLSRIDSLRARGSTPMGMGLRQAIKELNRNARTGSIKVIIFASDGHHNTGPSPERFYNQVPSDTYVYTIGVGSDIRRATDCGRWRWRGCKPGEVWLKEIASTGNGKGEYFFVPDASRLTQVYQDLLQEIRNTVVAENIRAYLKFHPELEFISASPTPDVVNRSPAGDSLQWSLGQLSNGESAKLQITLRAVRALANQPQSQSINYPFPQSRLEYINPAGPTTEPIPTSVIRVREIPRPFVDIKANNQDGPITVGPGEQVQITWSSQYADSCNILPDNWRGLQGSRTVSINFPITYSAQCTNERATASDSVTINTLSPIECSPKKQIIFVSEAASLSATGGSGLYAWEVTRGAGNPSTGTGSSFSTRFDLPGSKRVTVKDTSVPGQQDVCEVFVESFPTYQEE